MEQKEKILQTIKEKESLIKKIKNEIQSLEHEVFLIDRNNVLTKFKLGDILVYEKKYLFKLEMIDTCCGFARTQHVIYLETNKNFHYQIYPQPVCKLDELFTNGRKANKKEIKHFELTFKKGE